DEAPIRPAAKLPASGLPEGYALWAKHNVRPQKQQGYSSVIVKLPLGDFTPKQGRGIADLARELTGDTLRLTADQNLLFRWVSGADLPALYERLVQLALAEPG